MMQITLERITSTSTSEKLYSVTILELVNSSYSQNAGQSHANVWEGRKATVCPIVTPNNGSRTTSGNEKKVIVIEVIAAL